MFKPLALIALSMAIAAPAVANDHKNHDVVYDKRGGIVRSAVSGDCVYAHNQTAEAAVPCAVSDLGLAERTVYFAFGSSKLTKEGKAKLDTLAAFLTANQGRVQAANIVGYADRIGNPKANMALSKKRAQAVAKYLTSKGVVNARVAEVRALGETAPQTDCQGDKTSKKLIGCLAPDRRVEVEVEYVR
jgi:OOP family OmpA-OmpF porin